MTKAELLADLAAKPFVAEVYGTGQVQNVGNPETYYNVRIKESPSAASPVGGFRQVAFYVIDEGEATEEAFYQGGDPFPSTNAAEFRKWMLGVYEAAPGTYPGLIVHQIDEVAETAIISRFKISDWTREFLFVDRNDNAGEGVLNVLPSFDLALLEYNKRLDGAGDR